MTEAESAALIDRMKAHRNVEPALEDRSSRFYFVSVTADVHRSNAKRRHRQEH